MKSNYIGIDLGSYCTRIYIKKDNKIIKTKSLIALDTNNNEKILLGEEADNIKEREPQNLVVKKIIKKGKIEDDELTLLMLKEILKKNKVNKKIINPSVLLSVDDNLSNIDKSNLIETIRQIGTKNIYVLSSIKLIAYGIGMDFSKNTGRMIIDIGYEKTQIAVLSLNDIVAYTCIDIGGNNFNDNIIEFLRNNYKLIVGPKEVENIKKQLKTDNLIISGRNVITDHPEKREIKKEKILDCLNNTIGALTKEIKKVLGKISPELFNDIASMGIIISGGGSMLDQLIEKIEDNMKIPILNTINPDENIIKGIKYILDNDIRIGNKII